MSGGLLKALRSDSYVELSQYRDQHFRVREGGPREREAPGRNAENRLPFSGFLKPEVRPGAFWGMDAAGACGYHRISSLIEREFEA